jgi:hypothetical protein
MEKNIQMNGKNEKFKYEMDMEREISKIIKQRF